LGGVKTTIPKILNPCLYDSNKIKGTAKKLEGDSGRFEGISGWVV
jgi:hypothetical protein